MKLFNLFARTLFFHKTKLLTVLVAFVCFITNQAQNGRILPTDQSQTNFLKTYKLLFDLADNDYRSSSTTMDTNLFPKFGEYSPYWILSGSENGSFLIPDTISPLLTTVTAKNYTNYTWKNFEHRSIQFKKQAKKIAVFRSKLLNNGYSVSWEAQYFKNLFETFLYNDIYYFINEDDLNGNFISDSTDLLIIPSFTVHTKGEKYFIDSIFKLNPVIKSRIETFLGKGKMVYTEGNAAYFIQKCGFIGENAVDFNDKYSEKSELMELTSFSSANPISVTRYAVNDKIYGSSIPRVDPGTAEIIAQCKNNDRVMIFEKSGNQANGGRIICNLAMPTVGGILGAENGSRQLQWTLNTLLYHYSSPLDVTRKIYNVLPPTVIADENSISYDRVDTFEVRMQLRNLSGQTISSIEVKENLRGYFTYIGMISSGTPPSFNDGILTFQNLSLAPYSESTIIYQVVTPSPDDNIHESINKLLDHESFAAVSLNTSSFSDQKGFHQFSKKRNYANVMFSARLFGDADINWKNFLGLHWQPFKVFMNLENKERTEAQNTVYTQYIPKDMPFYRSDGKLNIPVVKTPGGTYIDILHGSDNRTNPGKDFDMDGDGDPDVWLDTTSIYPKGYHIQTEEVFWANPWKTLQSKLNNAEGKDTIYYEDINHDGHSGFQVKGIDYLMDPNDKIRAWKITWPIGTVKGNDYFEPYCSAELWVDAPDMVAMAQGVGWAYGKNPNKEGFYPYKTLDEALLTKSTADCWVHWMDKEPGNPNNVLWTGMYKQKMYNYQGYAFMDPNTYVAKPWDTFYGNVPKPHEEFIAVISMGGEEIDMIHPAPSQSLYSKIDYQTIFNEKRVSPIRTTYSFYAPLPNPMQFEYLSSNYSISDTLDQPILNLPAYGKAKLKFDLDASTEYSYYWIRNVGHVVDRKPDWIKDNGSGLGSGVFGYMIYEIPKGLGGYKISLPRKPDGTFDINSIVSVDGKPFEKWLTNPNTGNEIEIWENPFNYQVYIPQLLIPPALSDKNGDGVDDWIDDLGDRYSSGTGYLHDPFMAGDGEMYPEGSSNVYPHTDDGISVTKGWSSGTDHTYGSDHFDDLGRTHFTFHALYEGLGKEGPVDISKGGTLVVEEIFGGSPWVIFSHALTANAEGVNLKIRSTVSPTSVKYGIDTVCIKHTIEDLNEPHEFNSNLDPYRSSVSASQFSATAMAGGKDPCDWVSPNTETSSLIDPLKDKKTITLIPGAIKNTALTQAGYPKIVSGAFLVVKVEINNTDVINGKSFEWLSSVVKPDLSKAGNSKVVLSYVAYPRPLVPGDQPAIDTTAWRFNQPEGEILTNLGDTLKIRLQASRKAYFVFLIQIDETLKKGIYDIGFTFKAKRKNYKGETGADLIQALPPVKFSIIEKGNDHKVKDYQKFKIGESSLKSLTLNGTVYFEGLNQVKYASQDVNFTDFSKLTTSLPASYSKANGTEIIDLSKIQQLPNADTSKLYLLEKVAVNSYRAAETIDLTSSERLDYQYKGKIDTAMGNKVTVSPYGPRILIRQKLYSVNGVPVTDSIYLKSDTSQVYLVTRLEAINVGSDVSENTMISIHPGPFYIVLKDSLPSNVSFTNGLITANLGLLQPGESKYAYIYYTLDQQNLSKDDLMTVIKLSDIQYETPKAKFVYQDPEKVLFETYDFLIDNLSSLKTGNRVYHISAKATNRGLPAENVWFRIYPVIGGGISEFPIKEMKIDHFLAGETVELDIDNYSAPNDQKLEVVAKIDDGNKVKEILEQNNAKVIELDGPLGLDDKKAAFNTNVYPNPFVDEVHFNYSLENDVKEVSITVFNQKGSEIVKFIHCPRISGMHEITWSPGFETGNYIYRISIVSGDGSNTEIPGIIIKTEK